MYWQAGLSIEYPKAKVTIAYYDFKISTRDLIVKIMFHVEVLKSLKMPKG